MPLPFAVVPLIKLVFAGVLDFVIKYWKIIVPVIVLVAYSWFIMDYAADKREAEVNNRWIATYASFVESVNLKLSTLETELKDSADQNDKAKEELANRINIILGRLPKKTADTTVEDIFYVENGVCKMRPTAIKLFNELKAATGASK